MIAIVVLSVGAGKTAFVIVNAIQRGNKMKSKEDQILYHFPQYGEDCMEMPLRDARDLFERNYLLFHINRFGGNISRIADFIKLDRSALYRKLNLLGITQEEITEQREQYEVEIQQKREQYNAVRVALNNYKFNSYVYSEKPQSSITIDPPSGIKPTDLQ